MMLKLIRENLSLADVMLFIIIVVVVVLTSYGMVQKRENRRVYIIKENHYWADYPLSQDRTIVIDEHNTLQIADGKVRMLEADCPDKRCVKQGASDLLPIICLPNHLVVEIRSTNQKRTLIIQ